ncbi:MAG: DJ-1/PfpI family protein [Roseofilum sp. SBFL]|nr:MULTISPECIES: DJ-1/PfpI family protein [unclassified Roseofilum]HBQ99072.1 glutamine amidotransferase [Cyanobacteria bacterium UBA11691]MBP0007905.1 DJ-1/PfpI family protein [Roseofilum sp. Belize Diploria]MBP0014038.1 DJ-1/PfpI family protein [Roseofilum sp. SID3]MBP0023084.1 DJ-1/PfpI family protein [Roseofilum sp. SID2]MBP0032312.1 DJ-1/PfpI family protein [Roseofilum sp. Belize BBD 4]
MNIGIYIYEEAEVLDFSDPFEVFSTAARLSEEVDLFNVFLVAESNEPIKARGGYMVLPNFGFSNHPSIDVLIVVGGVHIREMRKTHVIEWISLQANKASIVASVCTGAFLLAQAGVLKSNKVTTHWEDTDDLRRLFPKLEVVEGVRWVDEGNLLTSLMSS